MLYKTCSSPYFPPLIKRFLNCHNSLVVMGLRWDRVIGTASAVALIACLVLPGPRKSIYNKINGFCNFNKQVFRQLYYGSNFISSREKTRETKKDLGNLERKLSYELPEEQIEQLEQLEQPEQIVQFEQPEKEEYIFKNKYPVEPRKRPVQQKQGDSFGKEEYQALTSPKPTVYLSKNKLKEFNIKIIGNYGNVLIDTNIIRPSNFDTNFTAGGQNITINLVRKYETNLDN